MPYGYRHRQRGYRGRHGPVDRPFRHHYPPHYFEGPGPYGPPSPMMPPAGAPPNMGTPPSSERPSCGDRSCSRGPSPPPDARHWGCAPPHHGGWGHPDPRCVAWDGRGFPQGNYGHHMPWVGRYRGGMPPASGSGGVPVLTYFDIPGLAEPIRLIFTAGHIPFEDKRVTSEEWANRYKNYSPLKQVPILEVDGQTIVQSHAILQYAAMRAGFWPQDEHQQLSAGTMTSKLDDARQKMRAAYSIADPEERKAKIAELATTVFPPVFAELEALVAGNGQRFAVGPHLSYVDFLLAQGLEELKARGMSTEEYPKLVEIGKMVFDLPPIRRYRNERKPAPKPIIYDFHPSGLAMVPKWCLTVGDIEFEEVLFTQEEVEAKKADPSFSLPYIEVDGKSYSGQMGMLAYTAARADLIPEDALEIAHAWAIVRSMENGFHMIVDHLRSGDEEALKTVVNEVFVPYVKSCDPIVAENQDAEGHVVSNSLTFADLFVAMVYLNLRTCVGHCVEELNLPAMRRCYQMVMNIEAIKNYQYTRSKVEPVLNYCEGDHRAESIKMILKLSDIKYTDREVGAADWEEVYKKSSPVGDAPYMEVDGQTIGETKGCLTYVAERAGLLPPTYLGRAQAEMIYSAWWRVIVEGLPLNGLTAGSADYESKAKELRENQIPAALATFEKLIGAGQHPSGYLVDNQLTYIDFYIAAEFQALIRKKLVADDYSERYPNVTKVWTVVNSVVGK